MAILLATYDIYSSDDRIEDELDQAVFDVFQSMDSETVVGGLWYIRTRKSPNFICDQIVEAFNKKKNRMARKGFDKRLLDRASISLFVNKLTSDEWVSFNDRDLEYWLRDKNFGSESNFRYDPAIFGNDKPNVVVKW